MTRTVADTALMLQVMAGADESDPWSYGLPASDYLAAAKAEGDLRGKRILFCAAPPGRPIAAEVAAAFATALGRLRELGAELDGNGWAALRHRADVARHQPHDLARSFRASGRA